MPCSYLQGKTFIGEPVVAIQQHSFCDETDYTPPRRVCIDH
jgi:hypothetical protein